MDRTAGAGPLADFSIGQRVNTVEGYPGTVVDVHEGPGDLTTIWVTLDGGLGGGEYGEAELTPIGGSQASLAAIVEAGVEHTAADDYPELGTILTDRLPPQISRHASKTSGAAWTHADDDGYDDDLAYAPRRRAPEALCTNCFVAKHGYEPEMGDQETSFAPGGCDGCGREAIVFTLTHIASLHTAGADIPGSCDVCGKAIKIEKGNVTHADGSNEHAVKSDSAPIGMQASATSVCTDCGQSYDPQHPEGDLHDHWTQANRLSSHTGAVSLTCDGCGQQYFTDDTENPSHGCSGNGAKEASGGCCGPDGCSGGCTPHLGFHGRGDDEWDPVVALYLPPVPSAERGSSNEVISPEQKAGFDEGREHGKGGVERAPSHPEDPDFMSGYSLGWAEGVTIMRQPANSWDIDDLAADQISGVQMGQTDVFHTGAAEAHEAGAIQWVKDNSDPNTAYSVDWCRFRRSSHCWLPKTLNEAASAQAGYAVWNPEDRGYCSRIKWDHQKVCPTGAPGPNAHGFTDATVAWEDGGQRGGIPGPAPINPDQYRNVKPGGVYSSLAVTAAFEMTAAWSDVRRKAKRIRQEAGVRIVASMDNVLVAHIKGDTGVYETEIVSFPGKRNAAKWNCGCKWGSVSWGRSGPWKRFEGRMCSHALALQYEAQSRGFGGKAITLDEKQPAWMDGVSIQHNSSLRAEAGPLDDGLRQRLKNASTLEAAAQLMLTLARREEPKVVNDIKALVAQNHGELVGLEHRMKSEGSLLRKMKAEATLFRNPGEAAMNMSDTLRFTALFTPENYTQDTNDVLNGLRSRGYKTRTKNYWGRGDAYNGVNVALTTPGGHPVELQFHTEDSFSTKETLVHPIYEKWREEADPNRKAILGHQMRDQFDNVPRPRNALGITDLKRQPMTPYKDINWYPGKAASAAPGSQYRYLALHLIDTDPVTPDEVYAVLRVTDSSSEIWRDHGWQDDPEFGRYCFLGDPTSEEIDEAEADLLISELDSMQAVSSLPPGRHVDPQNEDEIPAHVVAARMLAEGAKYAAVRQMLLSAGVERPAQVVSALRTKAFTARVDGEFVDVDIDDDGFHDETGERLDPAVLTYPGYHPTLGLDPTDEKVLVHEGSVVPPFGLSTEAMPVGPPPQGIRYLATSNRNGNYTSTYVMLGALLGSDLIGYMTWGLQGRKVQSIWVAPEYRRRRVAETMLGLGKTLDPALTHHVDRTDEGDAWVRAVSPDAPIRENDETEPGHYEGGGSANLILDRLLDPGPRHEVRDLTPLAKAAVKDDPCTACSGTGEQRSGHECYICEATGTGEAEREGRARGYDNSNPENGLPVGQDDSKRTASLTLYRGEGSHDKPSYYPKGSTDAGGWWTTDLASATQYAKSTIDGKVYVIEVDEHEAERRGLPQYRFIPDPTVRERRRLHSSLDHWTIPTT